MGRKVHKLKAEIKSLHKVMASTLDHLQGVGQVLTSHQEQISALRASNVVIAESLTVISKSLQLPSVPIGELQGYQ